jgi:hypothetical protein
MKILSLTMTLILFTWAQMPFNSSGALLEAAKNCDEARDRLIALVNNPDNREASQVMDSLGVDVVNSCSVPKGKILCFQCLDKNGELSSLQLFHDSEAKKFEFLGFGCRCKE